MGEPAKTVWETGFNKPLQAQGFSEETRLFVSNLNSPHALEILTSPFHESVPPMISSPSASSDAVTLYATDEGTVVEQEDGSIVIRFESLEFTLQPDGLSSLRDVTRSLAADVRRCGSGCRWQLRTPHADQRSVVVLSSDEVLALEDLVGGASAMHELNGILSDHSIRTE